MVPYELQVHTKRSADLKGRKQAPLVTARRGAVVDAPAATTCRSEVIFLLEEASAEQHVDLAALEAVEVLVATVERTVERGVRRALAEAEGQGSRRAWEAMVVGRSSFLPCEDPLCSTRSLLVHLGRSSSLPREDRRCS